MCSVQAGQIEVGPNYSTRVNVGIYDEDVRVCIGCALIFCCTIG
jgi:hypothetical protein